MKRDDEFLEATVGLCPDCLARLEAKVVARNGRVYVSRECPRHGLQLDLLEEDLEYYQARQLFANPGTPCRPQTAGRGQCPFDCGLCPAHQQHTCIGLIEITGACDLNCPVCFAGEPSRAFLPLDTFERMLDFVLESEGGSLDILQLSGGEPTLHPDLEAMITLARNQGVKYVVLNTNGLRLARDPSLRSMLAGFPDRFEVYLQFDGLAEASHRQLRGLASAEVKLETLAAVSESGIPTTLVMSVASGVNDGELGLTAVRALRTPSVRGISFQPVAYFGRIPPAQVRRTDRVTASGVMRRLEAQMKGMIRREDLAPLPCDPDGVALGYFHRDANGSFSPMFSRQEVKASLAQIPNTLRFSPEEIAAGRPGCAGSSCCGGLAGRLMQFFPQSFFHTRATADRARIVSESTFRVTVNSFVDAYNFDVRSCQRECVHVITPDLKKIPFSAYNLYHRRRYAAA